MTAISNKATLAKAINTEFEAFAQIVRQSADERFELMSNGKWSIGQNLKHLIVAVQPVILAMRLPKFMLRLMFGKCNRTPRVYEALVKAYTDKLAAGAVATGVFVPKTIKLSQKETLLKQYELEKSRLLDRLDAWSEEDLDTYILPHPILGKITVREMLFFTIYHTEHHTAIIQRGISNN